MAQVRKAHPLRQGNVLPSLIRTEQAQIYEREACPGSVCVVPRLNIVSLSSFVNSGSEPPAEHVGTVDLPTSPYLAVICSDLRRSFAESDLLG